MLKKIPLKVNVRYLIQVNARYLIQIVWFMYVPKELFNNFLVVKEKEIIKMVYGSACEVIDTGTVKVTERDGTVVL